MTTGIHHITAIAADAAATVNFYSHILGLRLVKKTVNQDDVTAYHLFFGDRQGHPGMDLTFFIFASVAQGQRGPGQVTMISLAVPESSLNFWQQRFVDQNVKHEPVIEKFGRLCLVFYDQDDQRLELVGVPSAELDPSAEVWTTSEVGLDEAIRYFYSATLSTISVAAVEPVLMHVLGYELLEQEGNHYQYGLPNQIRAAFLQVSEEPDETPGLNAAGTVHHIAFRAHDAAAELEMRQKVLDIGLFPTGVVERFYFKSVYFRVPAGILFEIATDGPGFTADEPSDDLGQRLSLPPFLESRRAEIEAGLLPLKVAV